MTTSPTMTTLPEEITLKILTCLEPEDLAQCRATCRSINRIARDKMLGPTVERTYEWSVRAEVELKKTRQELDNAIAKQSYLSIFMYEIFGTQPQKVVLLDKKANELVKKAIKRERTYDRVKKQYDEKRAMEKSYGKN